MEAAPESTDEPVGQVTQKISESWNPRGLGWATVGMAISKGGTAFAWLYSGHVFYGTWSDPFQNVYPLLYQAPNNDYRAIAAVGIAKNTNHTYAWYANGTVSEGDWTDVSLYSRSASNPSGQRAFTVPINPANGLRYSMADLIEVDNSDNGEWYYYWHSGTLPNSQIYRTTGTSVNATITGPTAVNTPYPDWASIVGIAFGTGKPASLYTYIIDANGNGQVNQSQNSLQLMPPHL
jgi:hypothetical protein